MTLALHPACMPLQCCLPPPTRPRRLRVSRSVYIHMYIKPAAYILTDIHVSSRAKLTYIRTKTSNPTKLSLIYISSTSVCMQHDYIPPTKPFLPDGETGLALVPWRRTASFAPPLSAGYITAYSRHQAF